MSKSNLMAILAITMALMTGCISADVENEAQYEVGSVYLGKTSNQRLQELPELSLKHLGEVGLQDTDSLAPASGVTYFQTYGVISPLYPSWEYVGASQFSTTYDHGGGFIDVAVLQYGYGNGGATLSGFSGNHYANELLCGSLSSIHYCSVGETVTGFMAYYEFTVPQDGNFSAYTDSIASPWGRKTDSINIR
jgi:hypothetical protein